MSRSAGLLARAFLCLLLGLQTAQAEPLNILIINSSKTELYERFSDEFIKTYRKNGRGAPEPTIEILALDRDDLEGRLKESVPDLIVTSGTKAARAITALGKQIPILFALIPESTYHSIAPAQVSCPEHSAIYIDQPLQRQAILAQAIFPQAEKYGVLLGPVSKRRLPEIKALDKQPGWQLVAKEVGSDEAPEQPTRELVAETDLLLAVNDPVALNRNNAKWLLYTAYQQQLPVIGFSKAYVNAGAAASVYSESGQIGQQAAEFTVHWSNGNNHCLPDPMHPKYYSVKINAAVTRSLGGLEHDEQVLGESIRKAEKRLQ
jgi:ABC-type uncharacterized transport system substrate-binding protein